MIRIVFALLLPLAAACQEPRRASLPREAPPPLGNLLNPYDAAARVRLSEVAPQELPGIHNVYRLSDTIISGGEPQGREGLETVKALGVKTILSVDGKTPDVATAKALGLRYVHVPILYGGLTEEQVWQIAKTFRELEGPFFVHCFHGKHRGPTAAAVGRLVLDGVSREHAAAEMRQWCGTAAKYEGLYASILAGEIPSEATTTERDWDFPAAHRIEGSREIMIRMTRHWDMVKAAQKRDWQDDPEHPDVDALNEAEKVLDLFEATTALETHAARPEQYRTYMEESRVEAEALVNALKRARAGDASAFRAASKSVRVLNQSCTSCHAAFRG